MKSKVIRTNGFHLHVVEDGAGQAVLLSCIHLGSLSTGGRLQQLGVLLGGVGLTFTEKLDL